MQTESFVKMLCLGVLVLVSLTSASGQNRLHANNATTISTNTLIRIIRAEDERRWNDEVALLLADKNAEVRERAALAAGRIGDERAVSALVDLLRGQDEPDVRQMAAFALGEIESPMGAKVLIVLLEDTHEPAAVRARAVEALGKIGAAIISDPLAATVPKAPGTEGAGLPEIRKTIIEALRFESEKRSAPDRETILLGLTAALRAKPDGAAPIIVHFLSHYDPRMVADALNVLARLRLKDGNERVRQMLNNSDAIVRANAARVLGATEDKQAFDALLDRALHDDDLRVRVSAIRALGSLKETRAAQPLVARGNSLISQQAFPRTRNELLEISSALGRMLPNRFEDGAVAFIRRMHQLTNGEAVEVEVALARIAPGIFQKDPYRAQASRSDTSWRQVSRRAQGLAAIRDVIVGPATGSAGDNALKEAQQELRELLHQIGNRTFAVPDLLQAYAPTLDAADAGRTLRPWLSASDVIIRATTAELIGRLPPAEDNREALISALKFELPRTEKGEMNDAALAILDALAKQKSKEANEAIKTALNSSDHLIRRKAEALLKANGGGDFSDRIVTVKTRKTRTDYARAIARIGKHVTATVVTSKGSFVIEFLQEDAPLTVDNFIQLARRGFFNGQTIPRVVPNFVIQAGDPRGDTNGGPGYQIRCEINEVPYERGAVGMALSGKDTGGSQWFVTHSPQPHLDGGYTVFGHVVKGMEVVDNIARGDIIRQVIVNEQ